MVVGLGYSMLGSGSNNTVFHIHNHHSDIRIGMEFYRMVEMGSTELELLELVAVGEAVVEEQLELVADSRFSEDLEGLELLGFLPHLRILRILDDDHDSKASDSSSELLGSRVRKQVGSKALVLEVADSRQVGLAFEMNSKLKNM